MGREITGVLDSSGENRNEILNSSTSIKAKKGQDLIDLWQFLNLGYTPPPPFQLCQNIFFLKNFLNFSDKKVLIKATMNVDHAL